MPAPDIAYNNIIIFITSHPHLLQLLSINFWICCSLTFSESEPTSPSLFTKDLLRSGHYLPPVRCCRLPNEDIVEGGSSSNHRDLIKREQDGIVDRRMSWKFKNILLSTDKSEPSQQFPFEWADLAPAYFLALAHLLDMVRRKTFRQPKTHTRIGGYPALKQWTGRNCTSS